MFMKNAMTYSNRLLFQSGINELMRICQGANCTFDLDSIRLFLYPDGRIRCAHVLRYQGFAVDYPSFTHDALAINASDS